VKAKKTIESRPLPPRSTRETKPPHVILKKRFNRKGNSKNGNAVKGKNFKIGAPSNYDKLKNVRDKQKKDKDTPQLYEAPDPICKVVSPH
jgi:hypothetical protein